MCGVGIVHGDDTSLPRCLPFVVRPLEFSDFVDPRGTVIGVGEH